MNDHFPDAMPEDLDTSDATCIICREEMTTAKRLNCGHLFHVHCLRSWLERQHTCPTCRAPVAPPDSGASTAGSRANTHQQGSGAATTSLPNATGSGQTLDPQSQHQARLQAAASAASIYESSFVYPSANSLACSIKHCFGDMSPGYALLPQAPGAQGSATNTEFFVEQLQNYSFAIPGSQPGFDPFLAPGTDMNYAERVASLENQKLILQNQYLILESQLRLLKSQSGKGV